MTISTQLLNAAIAWRDADPDPATADALDQLVVQAQADDPALAGPAITELTSAFAGPLEFGTAGLRGALGPGPARMNRVVVSQAAAGFAAWLNAQWHGGGTVIIGFDARYNSDVFARDTAEIMTGAGFEVLVTDQPTPTPVVAFGIQHYNCVAGVVVTASHNPPNDNGYKVYLGDGSQIVPPTDAEIAAEIAAVASRPLADIARGDTWQVVGSDLIDAYCDRAASLVPAEAPRQVTWVYTAMHGVGAQVVRQAVQAAGFPAGIPVPEQIDPDPAFPTVAFPNPEEPGAIDLSLALASEQGADLVIANDPDADRCAVAAPIGGTWRMLSGDELGSLIGHDFVARAVPGRFANSVVSSTLLRTMAEAAGREFVTTLTGFKWIGRVPDLAFGYEEAIGYCCDSRAVPDKDGITTALTVLRIAAELKAESLTLSDRLDEIALAHGVHATSQLSVRVADLSIIADAMARLRANPPSVLLGAPVQVHDLAQGSAELPPTDGVELTGEFVHVVARPSGTEPKLKCYLEVRVPRDETRADLAAARQRASESIIALRDEMAKALGV